MCVCVSVAFRVHKFSMNKEHFKHSTNICSRKFCKCDRTHGTTLMEKKNSGSSHIGILPYESPFTCNGQSDDTLWVRQMHQHQKIAAACFGHWRLLPDKFKIWRNATACYYVYCLVQQMVSLASLGPSASRLIQAIGCTWPVSSALFVYFITDEWPWQHGFSSVKCTSRLPVCATLGGSVEALTLLSCVLFVRTDG